MATGGHEREVCQRFEGADEDGAGGLGGLGDDIEAVVDAVYEVDVGHAGWAVHDFAAGCTAAAGVAGGIVGAGVGLGFDDETRGDGAIGFSDQKSGA